MSASAGARRKQILPSCGDDDQIDIMGGTQSDTSVIVIRGDDVDKRRREIHDRNAKRGPKMYVVPDEYNNNNGTSNLTPTTKHNPQNNENNATFSASDQALMQQFHRLNQSVSEAELRRAVRQQHHPVSHHLSSNNIAYAVEGVEPIDVGAGGGSSAGLNTYVVDGHSMLHDGQALLYTSGGDYALPQSAPPASSHSDAQLIPGNYVYTADGNYSQQYYAPYTPTTYTIISNAVSGGLNHSSASIGGESITSQQASPNSQLDDDDGGGQLSHTTRASPATIQWLLQNYETAEGVSLPRCTLYNHYMRHCREHKLDPVNAASFGKLIRSVFLGLRTRRLGTRGNSKYHYYGIRIKPDSSLNRVNEDCMPMALRQQPTNTRRNKRANIISTNPQHNTMTIDYGDNDGGYNNSGNMESQSGQNAQSANVVGMNERENSNQSANTLGGINDMHEGFMGTGMVPDDVEMPNLEGMQSVLASLNLNANHIVKFVNYYKQHCEDILGAVQQMDFNDIDECWRNFWQPEGLDDDEDENRSLNSSGQAHGTSELTQSQLFNICTLPVVQRFVEEMDNKFYQVIVDILMPHVLRCIPSTLTQGIRALAKRLEPGLTVAMQGAPEELQKIKLQSVRSLASTLRRYTSLNHLAQAARQFLTSETQIAQMLQDLNRVDFNHVIEQASWVCGCNVVLVQQLEKNFKENLTKQLQLDDWAQWLEAVVDQVLAPYHDKTHEQLAAIAKSFLLKCSMIMRDITLRSAASFGSFHLIRLLYDEYMFYLIEQRVARTTHQTTIAIMAQPMMTSLVGDSSSIFESPVTTSDNSSISYTTPTTSQNPLKRKAQDNYAATPPMNAEYSKVSKLSPDV